MNRKTVITAFLLLGRGAETGTLTGGMLFCVSILDLSELRQSSGSEMVSGCGLLQ